MRGLDGKNTTASASTTGVTFYEMKTLEMIVMVAECGNSYPTPAFSFLGTHTLDSSSDLWDKPRGNCEAAKLIFSYPTLPPH